MLILAPIFTYPIDPFSNTLSKSLSVIPIPSSSIINTTVFDISFDSFLFYHLFP